MPVRPDSSGRSPPPSPSPSFVGSRCPTPCKVRIEEQPRFPVPPPHKRMSGCLRTSRRRPLHLPWVAVAQGRKGIRGVRDAALAVVRERPGGAVCVCVCLFGDRCGDCCLISGVIFVNLIGIVIGCLPLIFLLEGKIGNQMMYLQSAFTNSKQ
jgi:hypothetical protein